MRKIILGILMIGGLIVGTSAVAAPVIHMRTAVTVGQTAQIQQVDYNWNHRRYKHRSWDRRGRRWRYY